jgi:pseudouridine-5'-phosphate glycosidase
MKIRYSSEVQRALGEHRAVVALESTIIAHGMPYPKNLEVAREMGHAIGESGAVPAIIAISKGEAIVGMNDDALSHFAQEKDILKTSRRDMAYALATGITAATTVSATMMIAHAAGIRVFATGGIGGVHRGASDTFDESADILELARTRVAVVSAGAKAILDLGLTLERLETHGVPVIGYRTSDFPAFYSSRSGHQVPLRCDDIEQLVALMKAQDTLMHAGGELIVQPLSAEDEIPFETIEPQIQQALRTAATQGVIGKDTTPFLLAHLNEITSGRSQAANRALAIANARLAGEIAMRYAGKE